MTSSLVRGQIPFLRLFLSDLGSKEQLKGLINNITRKQLKAIKEIVINVVRGSVPLDSGDKNSLQRYARKLRQLARAKISLKRSRDLLTVSLLKALLKVSLPYINSL